MFPVLFLQNAARAPAEGQGLRQVLLWLGVLILVTVAGGLLLMWFRRRVLAQAGDEDASSFMDELRKARDSGEMSEVGHASRLEY